MLHLDLYKSIDNCLDASTKYGNIIGMDPIRDRFSSQNISRVSI